MAPGGNIRPEALSLSHNAFASNVTAVQGSEDHPATPRPNGNYLAQMEMSSDDIETEKNMAQTQAMDPRVTRGWVPLPLRTYFWVPFIVVMILGAIGLELALHFSDKNNGWATHGDEDTQAGFMHYVYTFPPAAIATIVVAFWAWTDIEIKKMQPYVDLIRGDAPPQKSLLLDYTRTNNYLVWISSLRNRHYLVTLTSIVALLLASFSPLAASLFAVKSTWWTAPLQQVQNQQLISLNPAMVSSANATAISLLSGQFVAAAGYAGARIAYPGVPAPPFTFNGTTIGTFEVPTNIATNGTVIANTTAVLSNASCVAPPSPVNLVQLDDGSWNNSVSFNGCTVDFQVNKTAPFLYGLTILNDLPCVAASAPSTESQANSPVMFWFFTYIPSAMASVAFCNASIELWDVQVHYEIGPANISSVEFVQPTDPGVSNFSSLAANVSALGGNGFNGLVVNLVNVNGSEQTATGNMQALPEALSAGMFQSAVNSQEGLTGAFQTDGFVALANEVYTTYLAMIARSIYFTDQDEDMFVEVRTFRLRLWMSPVAVHVLAAALLLLALTATILHFSHSLARRDLILAHQPGTIASAVAIGAKTAVGDILADPRHRTAGGMTDKELAARLGEMKFMMNPVTLKIMSQGEEGYEQVLMERDEKDQAEREAYRYVGLGPEGGVRKRLSVFAPLGGRRRSFMPAPPSRTPVSPRSPAPATAPLSPKSVPLPRSPAPPGVPTVPEEV